MEISKKRK